MSLRRAAATVPGRRRARGRLVAAALAAAGVAASGGGAHAQHAHATAEDARLVVRDDPEAGVLTVRVGPLDLPARSGHHEVAQAPDLRLEIPFDGWLLSYSPRLVDGEGEAVPGRLLHHVAFWNTERRDLLCPAKEEHIFGAGGELNEWVALPGFGYRVSRGDGIRVSTMFHNPTGRDHPSTWLEVEVAYRRAGGGGPPPRSVYPVWFDVQECGPSGYDLEPGTVVTSGELAVPHAGTLLGVGGHLHDHGRELVLEEPGEGRVARLVPDLDAEGRIVSMPVVPFLGRGGHRVERDDTLRVTARYENPTGRRLPEGAMGIVVGYFLPDDPRAVAELGPPEPAAPAPSP